MDTTLRDGEQTPGVSFLPHEKLSITRLLIEDLHADRVEVGSACVSDGEQESVSGICAWAAQAGCSGRIEVLGFVDGRRSVDWIAQCGGHIINLLAKGSLRHCTGQLRKTPAEHIVDIINTVRYARSKGFDVNIYLEDWSGGMRDEPAYVFNLMEALQN